MTYVGDEQTYNYWVDGKCFKSEDEAKAHKEKIEAQRKEINYTEVDDVVSPFMGQFRKYPDQPVNEQFWCRLNKDDDVENLKKYLFDRYRDPIELTDFSPDWFYVCRYEWDGGDYCDPRDCKECLIISKTEVFKILKDIKDNLLKGLHM